MATETDRAVRPDSGVPLSVYFMVAALGIGYLCSMLHRQSFTILSVYMTEDLNMSSVDLGILGAVMLYTYALMQIPGGILVDRFGAKRIISLALVLASCSGLVMATAKSFSQAVLARGMAGMATAAIYVPALAAIRMAAPEDVFSFLASLLFVFGTTGGLLSKKPLGILTDAVGWRTAYLVIGALTFVAALAVWFTVPDKDKIKTAQASPDAGAEGRLSDLKPAILSLPFMAIALWLFTFTGTGNSFEGLWITTYLMEVQALTRQEVATLLTVIMLLAMVAGPIAGAISKRRSDLVFVFSAGMHAALFGLFSCLPGNMNFSQSMVWFLGRGLAHGALPVAFSQIRKLVPSNLTGTLLGVGNTVAFFGGAIFTQLMGVTMQGVPGPELHRTFSRVFIVYSIITMIPTILVWFTNFAKPQLVEAVAQKQSQAAAP